MSGRDVSGQGEAGPGGIPRLDLVTDDEVLARPGWLDHAVAVLTSGGPAVALHLRGPTTSGRRLHELAGLLVGSAADAGALLVVNDRVDVALAHGIGAVHLGRRSLAVDDARRLLGASASIGVSCHTVDEVQRAASEGAEWILAGTIFRTPSHPGVEGRGVGWIASVVKAAGRTPVIAIGGVVPSRVPELRGAGAYGVAAVRGIWDAPDPARAVREYIEALEDGTAGREARTEQPEDGRT